MLLSVIVPVHNGENYIKRCIDHVEKALIYAKIEDESEVIVINDGSTDKTEEICKNLLKEYKNIIIKDLNDVGPPEARNAGLDNSTGEYISFVDADDVINEDFFKVMLKAVEDTGADVVGCNFYKWSYEEDIKDDHSDINPVYHIYRGDDYLSREVLNGDSRVWSKIYKKASLKGLRFNPEAYVGEDLVFQTNMSKLVNKIARFDDYYGYGYYLNPNGAMIRPFRETFMSQIRAWELVRDEVRDNDKAGVTSKLMEAVMLIACKLALLDKKKRQENIKHINTCIEKVKENLSSFPEAYKMLDRGYRIKVRLFDFSPDLFMNIYHIWKNKK